VQLKIPHSLSDIGIDLEQSKKIGEMALSDPIAGGNPLQLSSDDYSRIF